MITEVLLLALALPLYVILFIKWLQFQHVIKMMPDVENIVNFDEFFADAVDRLKEGVEQHRKRECLKNAISKNKAYLLFGKKQRTHERVDKAINETIKKKDMQVVM